MVNAFFYFQEFENSRIFFLPLILAFLSILNFLHFLCEGNLPRFSRVHWLWGQLSPFFWQSLISDLDVASLLPVMGVTALLLRGWPSSGLTFTLGTWTWVSVSQRGCQHGFRCSFAGFSWIFGSVKVGCAMGGIETSFFPNCYLIGTCPEGMGGEFESSHCS